jgi:asparagine synthase (glutamine-hydrolysing)
VRCPQDAAPGSKRAGWARHDAGTTLATLGEVLISWMPGLKMSRSGLRAALQESVARHLVVDVPVGVFVFGGIDSGAVAGPMVEAGAQELEGLTIAYDEFAGRHEDEAPVAARLAAHYGIRHIVGRITRDEFLADLPRIFDAMDQPSIDGINTWYASKAIAEHGLKVAVSGVSGDELFQGYSSFRTLPRLLSLQQRLRSVPGLATLLATAGWAQARRSGNQRWRHLAELCGNIEGLWWLRRSVCAPEDLVELMGTELAREALADLDATAWVREMAGPVSEDPKLAVGQLESMTYLRNRLLRDSDWASMDHSVELRTPLVDAYLLGQVRALLPQFAKFPNKTLLANSPARALPCEIINRRKTRFAIPVGRWLKDRPGSSSWAKELVATYEVSA